MDIKKFIKSRPFLYHLTHTDNIPEILGSKKIISTKRLAESFDVADVDGFLKTRRNKNVPIFKDGKQAVLRDQAQVIEVVLRRSLEENCTYEDFLYLLNRRVFFWPTFTDAKGHYKTYIEEGPAILRVSTQDMFNSNGPPKFSCVNSGATRPHQFYDGNAVPRGYNTFALAENFHYIPSDVREVTFDDECQLPDQIWITNNLSEPFILVN